MNRKTVMTGLLSLCIAFTCRAQQKTLTLDEALSGAEKNYPSIHQKQLSLEAGKENQSLLSASLLPEINIMGQAAYQSEVTSLDMPGLPVQKPDNYNIGLDIRLPLIGFGSIKTRRQLEEAQIDLDITQVDVDFHQVRERITAIFGNVLLQKENENILRLRIKDLASQRTKVAAGVANGAVLKTNQLVLESEILGTQQRVEDIRATVKGLVTQLSLLTKLPIDTATRFQLTEAAGSSAGVNRPEIKVFETRKGILDLQSDLIKKELAPNLYIFGQGFYGRPGYNFLDTSFRTYGIGGVGLSWNLNNLFTQSGRRRVLQINKDILNSQEETFSVNLQAALSEKQAEIEKYQSIILKDAQILDNRREIMRATVSQLENGVITSSEYLTELNAQTSAQLNLVLHQIQLSLAIVQYNTLSGY